MDGNPVCNQLVLGKLPHAIKLKVMKKADEKGRMPTSVQLKEITAHVNSLQRLHTAGLAFTAPPSRGNNYNRSRPNSRSALHGPAHGNGANYRRNYNTGTYVADTENTYVVSKQQRRQFCASCGEPHWSVKCTVYATVAKRIRRFEQIKQCFFCLGGGHWSRAGPQGSKELCKFCQKAHHYVAPTRAKADPEHFDQLQLSHRSLPEGSDRRLTECRQHTHRLLAEVRWRPLPEERREGPTEDLHTRGVPRPTPPSGRRKLLERPLRTTKQQRRNNNNSNKKGANSSKQGGTPCNAAAASDESTRQKSGEACSDTGLLPGHQALLQTCSCRWGRVECPRGRSWHRDYFILAVARQLFLRDDEEISLPEITGHCSNPDQEEFEC
ncbi:hypothetical protein AAVH_39747, partial [Aphelenchoides avenae]